MTVPAVICTSGIQANGVRHVETADDLHFAVVSGKSDSQSDCAQYTIFFEAGGRANQNHISDRTSPTIAATESMSPSLMPW